MTERAAGASEANSPSPSVSSPEDKTQSQNTFSINVITTPSTPSRLLRTFTKFIGRRSPGGVTGVTSPNTTDADTTVLHSTSAQGDMSSDGYRIASKGDASGSNAVGTNQGDNQMGGIREFQAGSGVSGAAQIQSPSGDEADTKAKLEGRPVRDTAAEAAKRTVGDSGMSIMESTGYIARDGAVGAAKLVVSSHGAGDEAVAAAKLAKAGRRAGDEAVVAAKLAQYGHGAGDEAAVAAKLAKAIHGAASAAMMTDGTDHSTQLSQEELDYLQRAMEAREARGAGSEQVLPAAEQGSPTRDKRVVVEETEYFSPTANFADSVQGGQPTYGTPSELEFLGRLASKLELVEQGKLASEVLEEDFSQLTTILPAVVVSFLELESENQMLGDRNAHLSSKLFEVQEKEKRTQIRLEEFTIAAQQDIADRDRELENRLGVIKTLEEGHRSLLESNKAQKADDDKILDLLMRKAKNDSVTLQAQQNQIAALQSRQAELEAENRKLQEQLILERVRQANGGSRLMSLTSCYDTPGANAAQAPNVIQPDNISAIPVTAVSPVTPLNLPGTSVLQTSPVAAAQADPPMTDSAPVTTKAPDQVAISLMLNGCQTITDALNTASNIAKVEAWCNAQRRIETAGGKLISKYLSLMLHWELCARTPSLSSETIRCTILEF